MVTKTRNLNDILPAAQSAGYAVGSFSARLTDNIWPILRAGERLRSPLIVQLASVEMEWGQLTPEEFAAAFREAEVELNVTVPAVLHLDHTQEFPMIQRAIRAGFQSVMIDASARPLEENIRLTREVVEHAHARGVSVEAELGRIGSADGLESGRDDELYTSPEEAAYFVRQTGVDALAVSVGTIHGVYQVRQPKIDIERLKAIRALVSIPLVLHGGSGNPPELIRAAIQLPGGGVSKINIATDLELAALTALGRSGRMLNREYQDLPPARKALALQAVEDVVADKIQNFLLSANRVV
ncbi:MAG TPA: class II fructose-bisphosphate aldolase [Anaerolineales bacterium]